MDKRPVMKTKTAVGSILIGLVGLIVAGKEGGVSWLQWVEPWMYTAALSIIGTATGVAARAAIKKSQNAAQMAYHEAAQALMKQK